MPSGGNYRLVAPPPSEVRLFQAEKLASTQAGKGGDLLVALLSAGTDPPSAQHPGGSAGSWKSHQTPQRGAPSKQPQRDVVMARWPRCHVCGHREHQCGIVQKHTGFRSESSQIEGSQACIQPPNSTLGRELIPGALAPLAHPPTSVLRHVGQLSLRDRAHGRVL